MEDWIFKKLEKLPTLVFIFVIAVGVFHGGRFYEKRYLEEVKDLRAVMLDTQVSALKLQTVRAWDKNKRLVDFNNAVFIRLSLGGETEEILEDINREGEKYAGNM